MNEITLAARYSAVSRGTERLVARGRVPESEFARMRCPFQAGDFPFPVKYGYALVGDVTDGPADWCGRTVFALHPHQSCAVLPQDAVVAVPAAVPPRRATLAANMETALTVVWDAGVSAGDRVLVVGAGVVGLLIARLTAAFPGAEVTLVDVNPARAGIAAAFGARFALPDGAPTGVDVGINASASGSGLATALVAAGPEARVVEASWLGAGDTSLALGGAFHAGRLTLKSSQVGRIPPERSPRWSHARRLATAMAMLDDPALDALVSHEIALTNAPQILPQLLDEPDALAIVIAYGAPEGLGV